MNIGEKIKQLRKANNMSQEELAEKLRVSRQSVSQWEQNSTLPSLDNLIAISKEFNVSLDDIVKQEAETNQPKQSVAFFPETKLTYNPKQFKKFKIIDYILIMLSISAAGFVRYNLADKEVYGIDTSFWISFALLIVPVASIVFYALTKKKGYRSRFNLVVSIIILIFILINLFSVLSTHLMMQQKDYPQIKDKIESQIDIKLPDETNTVSSTKISDDEKRWMITFTDKQVRQFEKELADSRVWNKPMSTVTAGLIPDISFRYSENYEFIYNATLDELNTIPNKSSTYHLYYLTYNEKSNLLMIWEYNKQVII